METLIIIGVVLLAIVAIGVLVDLIQILFPQGKECYISVKSLHTGIEYHASRFKFNRHGDMELYIYNHISHGYEWYPIWHFKNSFIVAMQADKDYAIANMYKLLQLENTAKDLTKEQKK